MYLYVGGIAFASFYDFGTWFGIVPTVWYCFQFYYPLLFYDVSRILILFSHFKFYVILLSLFQTRVSIRVSVRVNQRQNRQLHFCNYSIRFCNCSDGLMIFVLFFSDVSISEESYHYCIIKERNRRIFYICGWFCHWTKKTRKRGNRLGFK